MKQNIKLTHIFRRLIQIISFFLIPGLFANTFGAFHTLFAHAIHGTFIWTNISHAVWILMATIPSTVLFGRFFCGFFCSFGAMGDLIWILSNKLFPNRKRNHSSIPRNPKADYLLKHVKYLILIFFIGIVWTGILDFNPYSPWSAFGQLTAVGNWSSLSGLLSAGGFLLLLIVVFSFFVERFFCRYLCPLGAIYGILSKIHLFPITREDSSLCGSCQLCKHKCSMGIDTKETNILRQADCIKCMNCTNICPQQNMSVTHHFSPWIAVILTCLTITGGLYMAKNSVSGQLADTASLTKNMASGNLQDGIFKGEARGYKGITKVSVTIESGNITNISIDSHDDDDSYFESALAIIPQIIQSQNIDADAITGATLSSNGIEHAVKNALKEQLTSPSPKAKKGPFTDGIYTGSAFAFRGDVELSVTVENDFITDIRVISYYDNDEYFDQAMEIVIDEIIEEQDLSVDAVSGATYSSNGIILAAANALNIPETSLTLTPGAKLAPLHNKHGHVVKKYK